MTSRFLKVEFKNGNYNLYQKIMTILYSTELYPTEKFEGESITDEETGLTEIKYYFKEGVLDEDVRLCYYPVARFNDNIVLYWKSELDDDPETPLEDQVDSLCAFLDSLFGETEIDYYDIKLVSLNEYNEYVNIFSKKTKIYEFPKWPHGEVVWGS